MGTVKCLVFPNPEAPNQRDPHSRLLGQATSVITF